MLAINLFHHVSFFLRERFRYHKIFVFYAPILSFYLDSSKAKKMHEQNKGAFVMVHIERRLTPPMHVVQIFII